MTPGGVGAHKLEPVAFGDSWMVMELRTGQRAGPGGEYALEEFEKVQSP